MGERTRSREGWHVAAALPPLILLSFFSHPARAIIEGSPSGLGAHMVMVRAGGATCSGVAIGTAAVVTAAHCAGGAHVLASGQRVAVASVVRSAIIDGRRIGVAGDAAILILRQPLPAGISPIAVGDGGGQGPFTIAGFGTASEAQRGAVGALREAQLVEAGRFLLVDPRRSGRLSASACYGDSGGAVIRGGVLVGVITRASYPRAPIACGWYTQYAPVIASGPVTAPGAPLVAAAPSAPDAPVPAAPARTTVPTVRSPAAPAAPASFPPDATSRYAGIEPLPAAQPHVPAAARTRMTRTARGAEPPRLVGGAPEREFLSATLVSAEPAAVRRMLRGKARWRRR
jgi:hypothetical protein